MTESQHSLKTVDELFAELKARFGPVLLIIDAPGMQEGHFQLLIRTSMSPMHQMGVLQYAMARAAHIASQYQPQANPGDGS